MSEITVFTDGGARGNPGPAAAAAVAQFEDGTRVERAEYLGSATNNYAEYKGLLLGLALISKKHEETPLRAAHIKMDSELVVRQMQGVYRVKDATLQKLYAQAREIVLSLSPAVIHFEHIKRSLNAEADALVNKTLDAHEA